MYILPGNMAASPEGVLVVVEVAWAYVTDSTALILLFVAIVLFFHPIIP
jgi:hypothetical protein